MKWIAEATDGKRETSEKVASPKNECEFWLCLLSYLFFTDTTPYFIGKNK
jgi:hypothetical protein